MRISMKKVIATDLDGTLFYPRAKVNMIPKKNIIFLREFIEKGGRVVLVSGRSHHYAQKVSAKIGYPVDVIGANSAYLSVNEEVKEEHFLPEEMLDIYQKIAKKFHIKGQLLMSKAYPLVIRGPEYSWFKMKFYQFYYWAQGIYAEAYVYDHKLFIEELKSKQVYKMMLYFGLGKKDHNIAAEANKYIRENFPEIEASWIGSFVELTPKGCNKANGIEKYLRYLNIDKHDIIVVGDSGNDISMFNAYKENSFCMSHANQKVKKYAKHIIRRFYDLAPYVYENGEEK